MRRRKDSTPNCVIWCLLACIILLVVALSFVVGESSTYQRRLYMHEALYMFDCMQSSAEDTCSANLQTLYRR